MFTYEVKGPDYNLAFLSLARRVSAAHAYYSSGCSEDAEREIIEAMAVIRAVETTSFAVKGNG